jgi:hypothetical protein
MVDPAPAGGAPMRYLDEGSRNQKGIDPLITLQSPVDFDG